MLIPIWAKRMRRIAVIGLGNAGLPLATIIAHSGLSVVGIDVNKNRCEQINKGENPLPLEEGLDELIKKYGGKDLIASNVYESAKDCNIFIIIVPVLLDANSDPVFTNLISALESVGKILKKGDLIVLETTVPPGTTDKMVLNSLEEASGLKLGDFYLAHSPERIMSGCALSRLNDFDKIIGGVDKKSGLMALDIYKKFIPHPILVSNAKTAELIKIAEGCYRDVNIALANELFMISEEFGVNFKEVVANANHKYCHLHSPSTGVGGHCIPVYPWFLIRAKERQEISCKTILLREAREINDSMIYYWAGKIFCESMNIDKPLKDVKICIRGLTYRKGVKEFYHSRNLALVKFLKQNGANVYGWDPLITRDELEEFKKKHDINWLEPSEADVIFDCFSLEISTNKRGALMK
jgi:UDP-N-acetyl-D-mannosaminuronic acid dehydrogenase